MEDWAGVCDVLFQSFSPVRPCLLRELFYGVAPGDVLLGDRYDCGWFMRDWLQSRGVDFVVLWHQLRRSGFRIGARLRAGDHLVLRAKPARPDWLDSE